MGDHLGNSWRIAPQLASKSAGWPRVEHRLLAPPGGCKCSHRPSALRSAAPAPWKLGAASDAWLLSLPRQDEDLPPPSDRQAPDTDEWANVYVAVRTNEALAKYASPGAFNDPDMLVGSSAAAPVHFTPRQVQTQFSLWAVMAAPLLIGSGMPASDLATYSNPEVIAVSQDPMGVQGEVVWSNCPPFQPLPATAAPWPLSLQPAGAAGLNTASWPRREPRPSPPRLEAARALAAPAQPGAPPEQLGSLPPPAERAAAGAQDEPSAPPGR